MIPERVEPLQEAKIINVACPVLKTLNENADNITSTTTRKKLLNIILDIANFKLYLKIAHPFSGLLFNTLSKISFGNIIIFYLKVNLMFFIEYFHIHFHI